MKFFLISVFCALAAAHPKDDARIVNGKRGTPGKEYLAAIRFGVTGFHNPQQFCGGSVISSQHILTAAHCFYGKTYPTNYYTVGLGSYDLNRLITYEVAKVICHPQYVDKIYDNDICILKLAKPIDFRNTNIKAVRLPALYEPLPYHQKASVIGWGVTAFQSQNQPQSALETELEILTPTDASCYGYRVNQFKFCAGNNGRAISSTCQGDSGGPVVYQEKLFGIVSYAVGCNRGDFSGVYTRVPTYINWIMNVMRY